MGTRAIIIVPSQGAHAHMFADVAKAVDREVYGGKATVVTTTVTETITAAGDTEFAVTFNTLKGSAFSWGDMHDLSTVITISHGGAFDGPNLDAHNTGAQPWGTTGASRTELSTGAKTFWGSVGSSLKAGGKIILVGCIMGTGGDSSYGETVATTTGKNVFASDGLFAAADRATTLKHVKAIEKGVTIRPMKRFKPGAASK